MTLLLSLLACTASKPDTADVPRLLVRSTLNPFPNADLVADGHLALPDGALPATDGGTPWDVSRLNWRDGFSRVQVSVASFEVELDPTSLPGPSAIGVGGSVRIVDLTTGAEVPCFAELDAHPDAIAAHRRALLVRPMHTLDVGHHVAVAVTTSVRTVDGEALSTDDWAHQVDAGGAAATLTDALVTADPALAGTIAYAWDFPVGDGTASTRAIAASVAPPAAYQLDDVRTSDDSTLPAGTWKRIEGTYTAPNYLVDDTSFDLDAAGVPALQGTTEAYLYVHVPDAVRGAAPGTVPVLVFGHGLLSDPRKYLGSDDDPSNVVHLSNELGVIVVATVWRGLTTDDLVHAVTVSGDYGRFHEVTEMLGQGVSNTLTLMSLVEDGPLLDDPVFEGLPDRSNVGYYGISLGSIEGMVTLANQARIERAVLHVGGSDWSTMLERSSDWPAFEQGVVRGIPDPTDRQIAYAAGQLLWDPVDPSGYVEDLAGRGFLWQESIGDDQVPNLTTELVLRSAGVPLGTPTVTSPYAVDTVALPVTGNVAVQFDPELPLPPDENRPAPVTGAHEAPRMWEGTVHQVVHYFESDGETQHECGAGPCSASNPGA